MPGHANHEGRVSGPRAMAAWDGIPREGSAAAAAGGVAVAIVAIVGARAGVDIQGSGRFGVKQAHRRRIFLKKREFAVAEHVGVSRNQGP